MDEKQSYFEFTWKLEWACLKVFWHIDKNLQEIILKLK